MEVVTLSSLPAREDEGSSFRVLCTFFQACYTAFIPRSLPIRPHGLHLAVVMSSQSWAVFTSWETGQDKASVKDKV